jgi:alpha-tubulin suppressor-like RCC1 family protein
VSCAATAANDVFCWGRNTVGQLGIGSMSVGGSNTALQLPFFTGALEIDQLEVGCNASCVRSRDEIYCWGDNAEAIVDDTGATVYAPVRRVGLPF